jgi:CIC family chloride channel protein
VTTCDSDGNWDVDDLRAIIVERIGRIVGLIPPRSGFWRESVSNAARLVGDFAEEHLVVCRDVDLLSLVSPASKGARRARRSCSAGRIGRAPPILSMS